MFKRIGRIRTFTPFTENEPLSKLLGLPVYIKHEEYPGLEARKLDFLMYDIVRLGISDVVLYGRHTSQFTRLFVNELSFVGIDVHCVFADEYIPDYAHCLSLLHIAGAHTHGTQSTDYAAALSSNLSDAGKTVLLIGAGGARSVAAMSGVSLLDEIDIQLDTTPSIVDKNTGATIYVGVDSGATLAGMYIGNELYKARGGDKQFTIVGVPVFEYGEDTENVVRSMVLASYTYLVSEAKSAKFKEFEHVPDSVDVLLSGTSVSSGMNPYTGSFIRDFFKYTKLTVDYIYAARTAKALTLDIQQSSVAGPVVFVNPCLPVSQYFTYNTPQPTL